MKKSQILRGRAALEQVYRAGRRIESPLFRCYVRIEQCHVGEVRAAFGVPSRHLIAVRRNRIRRLMREAFAVEIPELQRHCGQSGRGLSLLLVYRPSKGVDARRLTLSDVRPDVEQLCRQVREFVGVP